MLSVSLPLSMPVKPRPIGLGALRSVLMLSAVVTLSACATSGGKGGAAPRDIPSVNNPAPFVSGTMRPYTIRGRTYRPSEQPNYDEIGRAHV